MQEIAFQIKSRYGVKWNFVRYKDFLNEKGKYYIESRFEGSKGLRQGYADDGKSIGFVDPDGGPFLSIGTEIYELRGKPRISKIVLVEKTYRFYLTYKRETK